MALNDAERILAVFGWILLIYEHVPAIGRAGAWRERQACHFCRFCYRCTSMQHKGRETTVQAHWRTYGHGLLKDTRHVKLAICDL